MSKRKVEAQGTHEQVEYLAIAGATPIGLYSAASRVAADKLVFVAGQLAVDGNGASIGEGDFAAQMRQVFHNMKTVLEGAGASMDSVAKFTTYVTKPEHLSAFYAERAKLFPQLFSTTHYPPNTLLVVSRLVRPEFLIEVEAAAAVVAV